MKIERFLDRSASLTATCGVIVLTFASFLFFDGCRKPPKEEEPTQVETQQDSRNPPEAAAVEKKETAPEEVAEVKRETSDAEREKSSDPAQANDSATDEQTTADGNASDDFGGAGGSSGGGSDDKSGESNGSQKGGKQNFVTTFNSVYNIFGNSNVEKNQAEGQAERPKRKKGVDPVKVVKKDLERASQLATKGEYGEALEIAENVAQFIRQNEYDRFGCDGKGANVDVMKAMYSRALADVESYSKHVHVSVSSNDVLKVEF